MKSLMMVVMVLCVAGCNLGTPSDITPIPTPDIPTVEILSPANNQQVLNTIEFDFDVVARDASQGIARVELYIDEQLINESEPVEADSVPVFRTTMNWRAQGIGLHIVEVYAYREDGTPGDAARITLEVVARDE